LLLGDVLRALVDVFGAFLGVFEVFFGVFRAFFGVFRAFFGVFKAFFGVFRAFFGVFGTFFGAVLPLPVWPLLESERPLSKSLPDIIGEAKTAHMMKHARAIIERCIVERV
jgi:hypothetical protein